MLDLLMEGCKISVSTVKSRVWLTKHMWCANNILTLNKTSNNTRKGQNFPLEKGEIFCFVLFFKDCPSFIDVQQYN